MTEATKKAQELLYEMADESPAFSIDTMERIAGELSALGVEGMDVLIAGTDGTVPAEKREGASLNKEYSRQCAVRALGQLGDVRGVEPIIGCIDSYLEKMSRGEWEIGQSEDWVGEMDNSYDLELAERFTALGAIGDVGCVPHICRSLEYIASLGRHHNSAEWEGQIALGKLRCPAALSGLQRLQGVLRPGSRNTDVLSEMKSDPQCQSPGADSAPMTGGQAVTECEKCGVTLPEAMVQTGGTHCHICGLLKGQPSGCFGMLLLLLALPATGVGVLLLLR